MPVPVYFSALVNYSVVRQELTSTRADAQRAAQTLRGLSERSSMVLKMAVLIAATGFRADAYVTDGAASINKCGCGARMRAAGGQQLQNAE